MSITIQQIIMDAKRLAGRLKDHDTAADTLMSQAQAVYKKVDGMKQYQDEANELNEIARQKSHTVLVAGIQQENKHLRELQQENRELRAALEEHQNALELIMSKYREQVANLVCSNKLDLTSIHNDRYSKIIRNQADKITEMAAVMEHAAALDETKTLVEQEQVAKLSVENKGLRELLQIACRNGIAQPCVPVEDKEIQTESVQPTS